MIQLSNTRAAVRTVAAAAFACMGLAGCNHDQSGGDTTAGGSYADLAVQLQNCASDALTCVKAANCDDAAEQVCRDAFKTCRDNTRAAYHAFHDAVKECFGAARECIGDARDGGAASEPGDGGTNPFGVCRDGFKMCVQDSRPTPPPAGPCLQGLRDCVQADEMGTRDCLEQAHTCFLNRLPMCGPTPGTEPTPGGGFPHRPPGHPGDAGGSGGASGGSGGASGGSGGASGGSGGATP
jgi:hypothetical protein